MGAYDDGAAMHDIQDWIAASGTRIMLIYGARDPWTAGAVELGAATDSFKYVAPAGNHGASIASLAGADKSAATATVMRWLGLAAKRRATARDTGEVTIEQEELAHRHHR